MGFGERTGRDLCVCKARKEKRSKKEDEKTPQPCRPTPFADVTSDSRLAEDQDVLRLSTSKQQMRAWPFENNTDGDCVGRKPARCVQSEKRRVISWWFFADQDSATANETCGCVVPAEEAAMK